MKLHDLAFEIKQTGKEAVDLEDVSVTLDDLLRFDVESGELRVYSHPHDSF